MSRGRSAPMFAMWLAVAVAAAILVTEALPARQGRADTPQFGGIRAVPPPAPKPTTFPAFAEVSGVTVHLPTAKPVGISFHEAFSRAAVPMSPYGRLIKTYNPRYRPPAKPTPGRPYFVMQSRGRGTASTSAVDIQAPAGSTLYAPVTGTVVAVRSYWLYGRFPDIRVEIASEEDPSVHVVMIHLERIVNVRVGQRVEASRSPIGTPRILPFYSQTDEYTHTHHPHVHLEVKRV